MLEVVEVMVQVEVLVQKVIMEHRVPLDQLVYIYIVWFTRCSSKYSIYMNNCSVDQSTNNHSQTSF